MQQIISYSILLRTVESTDNICLELWGKESSRAMYAKVDAYQLSKIE